MQKCLFKDSCDERFTCICKCSSPYLHFCDKHFIKHMRTPGDHVCEYIVVKFNHNSIKEFLPKLTDVIKHLKMCRNSALEDAKKLIEFIEKKTVKALVTLKELEKIVVDLISKKSISKEYYEKIDYITNRNQQYFGVEVDDIKKSIEKLYDTYNYDENWKECDQVIFPKDNTGVMLSINLNTFKLSNLGYTPKIGIRCHFCKIDYNTYFVQGGFMSGCLNNTYLLNIKDKDYEILKNGPTKQQGGAVLKNNKVYIFGGGNSSGDLSTSDFYDLKKKEWKSIAPLPQASISVWASTLGKNIILSGNGLNCCYVYNDSTYTSILNLQPNTTKMVYDKWVVAGSKLYENQDQDPSKWVSYNNEIFWGSLPATCVFKQKQFLYLKDESDALVRIDTKFKKLERIVVH